MRKEQKSDMRRYLDDVIDSRKGMTPKISPKNISSITKSLYNDNKVIRLFLVGGVCLFAIYTLGKIFFVVGQTTRHYNYLKQSLNGAASTKF